MNEHDPDPGIVPPDGLASSDGRLAGPLEIKYCGNTSRGLNLQARASLGYIPNYAGNGMLSEKYVPGLQQTPSRWQLSSFHERRPMRGIDYPLRSCDLA